MVEAELAKLEKESKKLDAEEKRGNTPFPARATPPAALIAAIDSRDAPITFAIPVIRAPAESIKDYRDLKAQADNTFFGKASNWGSSKINKVLQQNCLRRNRLQECFQAPIQIIHRMIFP